MADANGLMEAMKRAARNEREASKPVNVYFGKVVSKSPLKINVEQKMILGEHQLILTRNVTDYTITATVQWTTEIESFSTDGNKNLRIHNALEVDDEVILIRQQEGQKFIVVDRIGGK